MQSLKNKLASISVSINHLLTSAYFIFWGFYFFTFWSKALFINDQGGLSAGHVNIWGDWAAHLTMGSAMAYRANWYSSGPFLINSTLDYPFAHNWISAQLTHFNIGLIPAFIMTSFICSILAVTAIWIWFRQHFTPKQTILASLLFLLNGGIGFYYYLQEAATSNNALFSLLNPVHEYTRMDHLNIKWISVIDSMVIPQRAFALGFPLALIAITLIYQVFFTKTSVGIWKKLTIGGCILGLMPLLHTHSYLASFIILLFWSIGSVITSTSKPKTIGKWVYLAVLTGLLSTPLVWILLLRDNPAGEFIKWHPGWLANNTQENWLIFWFKNWGVVPFLSISMLLYIMKVEKGIARIRQFVFYLPFIVIFVLSNLILFQPYDWDNTKMFVWVAVGVVILFTKFSVKIYHKSPLIGIVLLGLTMFSGAIDTYRILRHDLHSYEMHSQENLQLAKWALDSTPSDSIWLTGDNHNHWLYNLTGRQSLFVFRGWLWTHGYDYLPVQQDVQLMYSQPSSRQNLIEKYGIDYIVVGPNEKNVWRANLNQLYSLYPVVKKTNNYTVFATTQDLTNSTNE